MRKILALAKPIITTYPLYANPLSILQLDYSRTGLWLLNHLMMMQAKLLPTETGTFFLLDLNPATTFSDYPFLWESPFLFSEVISREQLSQCRICIVDWVKSYITRGYYIYCYVQIRDIKAYRRNDPNATHDIFLFGFDDELQVFHAADYFDQVYDTITIPFSEFAEGFRNWTPTGKEIFNEMMMITPNLTKFKQDRAAYVENTFSMRKYALITISHLEEHLGLTEQTIYMEHTFSYGLAVYGLLEEYLLAQNTVLDWHLLYSLASLADHKTVMAELCNFYGLYEPLGQKWQELSQEINNMKLSYLKSIIKGSSNVREHLAHCLSGIHKADEVTSHKMLTCLRNMIHAL